MKKTNYTFGFIVIFINLVSIVTNIRYTNEITMPIVSSICILFVGVSMLYSHKSYKRYILKLKQ